jgi:hypothetical protein
MKLNNIFNIEPEIEVVITPDPSWVDHHWSAPPIIWCIGQFGRCKHTRSWSKWTFYFTNENDATLFKLIWL